MKWMLGFRSYLILTIWIFKDHRKRSCPGFPSTCIAMDITLHEMVGIQQYFMLLIRNAVSTFAISPSPAFTDHTGCAFLGIPHQSNGMEISQPPVIISSYKLHHCWLGLRGFLWVFVSCFVFTFLPHFLTFPQYSHEQSLQILRNLFRKMYYSLCFACENTLRMR